MKNTVNTLVIFIFMGLTNLFAQQNGELNTALASQAVLIEFKGMACQEGCADKIAENLKQIDGVVYAEVDYGTGKATLVYDPETVSLQKLEETITATKVKDYVYSIEKVTVIQPGEVVPTPQ